MKQKKTLHICGIHCASCELLIKRKLQKIEGVTSVNVNSTNETVTIKSRREISVDEIESQFEGTEYSFKKEEQRSLKSRLTEIGAITLFLFPVFLVLQHFEVFSNGITVTENMNYLMILGIGVVASFSSCIAVAGGLLLGLSAKYAKEHPNLTSAQKFKPHIFFNIGRLVSYAILGGIIGYIGSLLTISLQVMGIITLLASFLMIIIGLQLLQIFPFLNKIRIGIPKRWSEKILTSNERTKKATNTSALVLGGATFFLPCGFTQAMQLYVLSMGDPLFGVIAMSVFAIGTLPSFLSIGAIASYMKKEWLHTASVVAGILVIFLGIFLFPSALTLANSGGSNTALDEAPDVDTSGIEPQIVNMKINGLSYYPHQFEVKAGIPVLWVIDGSQARGCGQILTMPKMNIFERVQGQTVIEFTPTAKGELPFHCSMAMTTPNAKFIVT